MVSYHQHVIATIEPLGVSCHAGLCCGAEVSQLGVTINWFPHLGTFIVFSATMEAGGQEEGFQVGSAQITQLLYSNLAVSSAMGLISTSERHQRCLCRQYSILDGSHLDYPNQPFKMRFLMPSTGIWFSLWFLWRALLLHML